MITVGQKIKDHRLAKNYTQDYVASKLQISQNAFSKIELGYTDPNLGRIRSIAKVLEISIFDLIEE